MALIVEDGTSPEGWDSFASVAEADDYALALGYDDWTDEADTEPKEEALRRATKWIIRWFGGYFPTEGVFIIDEVIPAQVKEATIEAAIQELRSPFSLTRDVTTTTAAQLQRVKVGPIDLTYVNGSSTSTDASSTLVVVQRILSGISGYGYIDANWAWL